MGWGDVASGKTGGGAGRRGGFASVANAGVHPDHQQPQHHGGGGIGGFLGNVGHFVSQKAGLAAHDIAQIPGGTVQAAYAVDPGHAINDVLSGHPLRPVKRDIRLSEGLVKGTVASIRHPLRDPFQTALNVVPVADIVGRVGEAGLAGAETARAGEGASAAAKAAARKAVEHGGQPTRTLHVGEDRTPVTLLGSRNAGVRLAQRGYDRMVQKALDRNEAGQAVGRVTARLAKHGMKRVAGAGAEEERLAQRMRLAPAHQLDRAASKLSKLPGRRREEQAALELTSVQTPPEEAAAYHYGQAAKGVNPQQNTQVARLYERVAKRGLVHVDESRPAGAKVFINPAEEKLAAADEALAKVQKRGDTILAEHGVMTPQELQARTNAPARVRAGATYEKPTPGKLGVESPLLKIARMNAETIDRRATAALEKYGASDARTVRLQGAASVAKDKVQQLEGQAANRIKQTGIVGGEEARPGRGFVSERVSQKKLARSEAAASRSQVVPATKAPIDKKPYTGRALEQGLRPKHVTAAVSQHLRQLNRFVNTDAIRRRALTTGSSVRRSDRDVLIREPDETPEELNTHLRQALGMEKSAVDTPEELAKHAENAAAAEGISAARQVLLGHMLDKAESSKGLLRGEPAPKGYRWVDENVIRGLQDEARPTSGPGAAFGRRVDDVNSAITALTVYFKIGHVGTRVLTNAATNIMQGSMRPDEAGKSYVLWTKLSDEDHARALAASGQHGFAALPHEGTSPIAKVAGWGAQQWARHADAPFRFNSLAYELRKAGYKTPEQVHGALDALEHSGKGLPAHEWSKISAAARRADREAISYDRLNPFERRFLTRGIWFYPWVKGASVFAVRSMLEHPYKMALLGNAGAAGRRRQQQILGDVPSYEEGLVPLGKGSHPLTTDLSTFSPFATLGDVINAPREPGGIAGQFNPALGSAGELAYGLNQYGAPSKTPYKDALASLVAPTPESQIAQAFQRRGQDQSGRMFEKTPGSTLLRFLLGPATPRRVNKSALAKAAARERSGQR